MDHHGAIEVLDEAIEAIDQFHRTSNDALRSAGTQTGWDELLIIEQEQVQPALELARQIAAGMGASTDDLVAPPDQRLNGVRPFESQRAALVALRTRLANSERMAAILGPTGPQLSWSSFHPTVWNAAAALFDDGHYPQAVQTAATALEGHLQGIAGEPLAGQNLNKLFSGSGDGVRLHFPELDPDGKTYTSAREGAASLIRGAMQAVRNLVSHPEWPDPTEDEALEMLAVLSYVAHLVDRATPME